MAGRTFHFPKWSLVEGDIRVDVNLNRFEKQYQDAQIYLDGEVMNGMKPYTQPIPLTANSNTKER